ncbi:MAG: hypothetical protein NTW33_01975 [Methanoregula sp.]|nr:hypothetical protein [Methanoregula sp.]
MTITRISEIIHGWLGWCPNEPSMRTVPAVLTVPLETIHADRPDGSGPASRSGRVQLGVSIAAGSLKTMVRNRHLLLFSFLSGLVMFFLIVAEVWDVQQFDDTLPFLINIPLGNSFVVFDPWLFLVELICLSCFTILLAGQVLHRNGNRVNVPVTIREGFTGVAAHAGSLAVLSIAMALIATIMFAIVSQSQFFVIKIGGAIVCAFFWPPYDYVLDGIPYMLQISFQILFINIIPFLVTLWLVPVIVLEKKGRVPALAGLITLIQRTWCEMLGCILVYGIIVFLVAAVGLVIGQLPGLLYDHGFYLSMYLGHLLMTVVYYGFILACLILMAAGFSAAGIAIADLYRVRKSVGIPGMPEGNLKKPEPAS